MKKAIIYSLSVFLVAAILSGCANLKKMVDNVKKVEYKSTPNPLEMHAGKVPIDVSITFPPKYFAKNVKLVITPKLKSVDGTQEYSFPTQTVVGEKFMDNYQRISYKSGGTFRFQDTIDYKDIYRMSELELKLMGSTNKAKDGVPLIDLKIADGIKTTPELVTPGMVMDGGLKPGGFIVGKTSDVKNTKPAITSDSKEAKMFFDMQKSDVKANELKTEEMKALIAFITDAAKNPEKELKGVKIASYASPDGPEDMNQGLVTGRGKSTQTAFVNTLKKEKVTQVDNAQFIATETTQSEDWDGFKQLVSASNLQDKDVIVKVLSMYNDPNVREAEIKKLASVYTELKTQILPKLRRSVIKFSYESKAKTDAELLKLAQTTPEKLGQEEFLFTANGVKDLVQKEELYKKYTAAYPKDWRGWNNLAVCQTMQNKLSDAKANFQKADAAKSGSAEVLNNLGVIAMAEGDDEAALEYFQKSIDAGESTGSPAYNMGTIYIKKAKYADAVKLFTENSFNKALAQTLAGDNSSAETTLKNIGSSEYAVFYYLKAIVAAKGNKDAEVFENLKMAVAKDAKLKDYAKKDAEFLKYFENADFKSIVQ